MGLEWVFKLQDLVSGPAAVIERQLRGTTMAIKAMDIAASQTKLERLTDPLKRQRLELTIHRDQLRLNKMALDDHGSATSRAATSTSGWLNKLHDSVHLVEMLGRGFRWLGREALDMGRSVQEAVTFKERALIGLQTSLGAKGGSQMFDDVMGMAGRFGGDPQAMVGQAQDFARFGAPPKMASLLTKAMLDVRALGGVHGQRDADEVTSAIMGALGEGRITERTMRRFKGILPLEPMLRSLATAQGLRSTKQAEALLRSPNGAPGDRIIGMALEGVQALQKGPIGTSALKAAHQLEGSLERIRAQTTKLFSGVTNTPGFKKIESAFDNLAKVLGEGKTQGLLNNLANNLGAMLKPLTGPEGRKTMRGFFDDMKTGIENVLPGLESIVKAFGFLAKYGLLKPIQAAGLLSQVTDDRVRGLKVLPDGKLTPITLDERVRAALAPEARRRLDAMQLADQAGRDDAERASIFKASLDAQRSDSQVPQTQPRAKMQPPAIDLSRPRPNINVGGVTVKVEITGSASKDDAKDIARAVADQTATSVADSLEQISNEIGAQ